ncbi:MAG: NAD(P)H-hydrate epimerase [Anaerolineales bacterium]
MDAKEPTQSVPYLSAEQMVEVDRAMIEDYHIQLIQMMENAGRNLAHLARQRFLERDPRGRRVVILAGTGGNGGGALVAARWLHNWGAQVWAVTTRTGDAFSPVPKHQPDTIERMGVPVLTAGEGLLPERPDLVVDGILGYSLKGAAHGSAAELIRWANGCGAPVLSLDMPSGLDASVGAAYDPVIRATATLTLALPKNGLRAPGSDVYVGELYLADIGVPPELYQALGLWVGPLYAQSEVLRLRQLTGPAVPEAPRSAAP